MTEAIEQRTAEWHAARLGKVTASRIADITARTKSGPSASRANYAAELVAERLTGVAPERFVSAAMQHGTDTEEQARAMYGFTTGGDVTECGFFVHPTIAESGASPDGLVGDDGLVEIKCPNTATHIATLTGATISSRYIAQMQWQMACTGRLWCDFVSFDPRLPDDLQMHVERVERDPALIASLEAEVTAFLAEVAATIEQLTRRRAA